YRLNNGTPQSSATFTGLGEGTYEVTVMDASGFMFITNVVVITSPNPIAATADVLGDDIMVNASGGTGALQYSINGVDFQSSNEFLDQANGTYTITVMDENGCTTTVEAIV